MTINYNLAVSTSKPWTLFKLLLKWRGSIWKSVIVELSVWLCLYAIVSVIYRSALNPRQQNTFERIVQYCDKRLSYIPLNFMLGFFVTVVVNRWTYLYQIIGFIDNVGLMTAEYVRGRDEMSRMYRRNILRYCELAQVLVFRDISMRTRRRFPTLDTVVAAGFMLPHEKEKFDEIQYKYSKYWMPFQWALALTYDARKKGLIESDYYQVVVTNEIKTFRTGLAWICNYDWVPIPIMYPQLVCLAVHTYFMICILARQYVVSEHADNKTEIDLYLPIMSILQFIFYMGWMKVAEAMLNPFGEDDDDFETNALIDRNITMGLMIVDQGYNRPPELRRDTFWDEEVEPLYSEETAKIPAASLKGSASQVKLPEHVHEVRMVPHVDDNHHVPTGPDSPTLRRRVSIVPVRREDTRSSRRSSVSVDMFHSVKKKIERSMSRGKMHSDDEGESPRKSVSTSNLENMEKGKVKPTLSTQISAPVEGSENRGYSISEEDLSIPPKDSSGSGSKTPSRSLSGANIRGAKDFPHHVLDNVLEEDEEDAQRKKSIFEITPLERRAAEGVTALSPRTRRDVTIPIDTPQPITEEVHEESEDAEKEKQEGEKKEEGREKQRSSEFFIGHMDGDDHH